MGRKSRDKWKRRQARDSNTSESLDGIQQREKPSVRNWLRATGASAILLGGLGLMQTFFWPSVCAVYFGLAVLGVDAFYEKFAGKPIRGLVIGLLLLLACAFTKYVVLWSDPLEVKFVTDEADKTLRIYVVNNTRDDFKELDVHIILPSQVYVTKYQQVSQLASCSLFPVTQAAGHTGERLLEVIPNSPVGAAPTAYFGNYQRVRCEVLPHESVLHLALTIREGRDLAVPKTVPEKVRVEGSYRGKFRVFTAPTEATLLTTQSEGWKFDQ